MLWDGGAFDLAAGLNFEGDIFRDVLRPVLKRIPATEGSTKPVTVTGAR